VVFFFKFPSSSISSNPSLNSSVNLPPAVFFLPNLVGLPVNTISLFFFGYSELPVAALALEFVLAC
jgi:hypothetical protein